MSWTEAGRRIATILALMVAAAPAARGQPPLPAEPPPPPPAIQTPPAAGPPVLPLADDPIAQLLEVGWSDSLAARDQSDSLYRRAQAVLDDPRLPYAYVLVLMKQYRHPRAEAVTEITRMEESGAIVPLMARIWLTLATEKSDEALFAIEKLSRQLADNDDLSEEQRAEATRFMGRALGILQGPMADPARDLKTADLVEAVQRQLPSADWEAADQSRQQTLQRYSALMGQITSVRNERLRTRAEEVRAQWSGLRQQLHIIEQQMAQAQRQAESDQQYITDSLAKIGTAQQPMWNAQQLLQLQALNFVQHIAQVENSLQRALGLAGVPMTAWEFSSLMSQFDRLSFLLDDYYQRLAAVDWRAAEMNAGLLALGAEAQAIATEFQTRRAQMANMFQGLDETREALMRQQQRLIRGVDRPGPRILSLAATASAVPTYLPFPLEQAKADLLESLRERPPMRREIEEVDRPGRSEQR